MTPVLAAMLAVASSGAPVQSVEAAAVCPGSTFDVFFTKFIWSRDVRREHTGPTIEERSFASPSRPGIVRRADPDWFDIALINDTYADELSARRWQKSGTTPYVPLWLDVRKLPGGGWRVEYQPAMFHDDGKGGAKTLIRKTGKPRAYIFAPSGRCWKLVRQLR
jgi:hypothetical protein